MKDVLITSSVLILALLVLRRAFRNTISRRVQYALWGLVLVRLLVPVSLPGLAHNVLTVSEPARTAVSQQVGSVSVYLTPVAQGELSRSALLPPDGSTPAVVVRDRRSETVTERDYTVQGQSADAAITAENGTITWYAKALPLNTLLTSIWYAGIAVMAFWLVISNLRFWRRLHKVRIPYSVENCGHPIYLVESGLPSPCLFGLFRPAIYLTPAAVETPERLHHVIAHETTHARHLDPLWSLLRCVCLAVYWFDPLVWAAAIVSRTDCELACDEGALRRLDSSQRIAYGQTLLSLIPVQKAPASPVLTATTMTAGKRQLKDRITRIAENRQTRTAALFLVLALAAAVCAATFTGAAENADQDRALTGEEVAYFNQEFSGESAFLRRQFLTSLYERPEDIDLFELFYCGTGLPETVNESELRQAAALTHRSFTEMELDLTASSRENINAVLLENTGLTLEQTHQTGLEKFLYLPEYDTYYHFHSDTNAIVNVTFAAGEREGDLTRLYYRADGMYLGGEFAEGWACLTLREVPGEFTDGFPYHFVSHQLCRRPDHLLSDVVALNGEELAYFNEEFFNNDTVNNEVGVNIHNQFLTSLYERPEDIDLYELFYCGTGTGEVAGDEELPLVGNFDAEGGQICPTDKLSVSAINSVLLENTGLALEQTNQIGLENFTYLEQYGAYYHTHGDTNYFHSVHIAAGEREGDVVRLYYPDSSAWYSGIDWLCVTLKAQPDGSYWFVSNQPSEKPSIPTVYPEGDPVLTIPLTDLEPYEPSRMSLDRRQGDCETRGDGWIIDAEDGSEVSVRIYLSTDGNLYAALVFDAAAGRDGMSVWDVGRFFTFPEGNSIADGESTINTFFFSDLFGHNGWQVSYRGQLSEHAWTTFTDYFYFEDSQTPVLLAHTHGLNGRIIDLDGDGANELINEDNQLFFQRDGQLYEADITALLQENWPEMTWWDYSILDADSRCLMVRGFVEMPAWGEGAQADFLRYVYYDGEQLLVYDDLEETEDHAAASVLRSGIPEQVLADGKAQAQAAYEETKRGQWDYDYEDWRVSSLSKIDTYTEFGDLTIEVYGLGYQFHTAEPSTVMLAGGMYLQEDGWVGGLYAEESPYLVYQLREDGTRLRLDSRIDGDCSIDSPAYRASLCRTLLVNGLLPPSDIPARDLLVLFYLSPARFLNEMAAYPETQQTAVFSALASFQSGGQEEQGYLQEALQTLGWTLRDLTEQGQSAYGLLQAALHGTLDVKPLLESLETSERISMTLTTASGGGGRYTGAPRTGNSRQRVLCAVQDYDWTVSTGARPPAGADTLVIESGDGTLAFQFWAGSDLVCCTQNDTAVWYQAVNSQADDVFATDMFSMIRIWYDEMEWRAMTAEIVIPDQGQDRLEIAQAWVDQYEGTSLRVTRGSKYANTYVRAADVHLPDTIIEASDWEPPAPIQDEPWFLFWYTGIFVPENPVSMQWSMAGNTGEYDGTYGEAPEDALSYGRCGYLYLTETGWRCASLGTGP